MNTSIGSCSALGVALLAAVQMAAATPRTERIDVPGLNAVGYTIRDVDGIPHFVAGSEHDALFMQGYIHARDRFFQMDLTRRQISGTLAEVLGTSQLASDVQLRTLGMRRAAEASLPVLSPEVVAGLEAYADGVNAWLGQNALPAEYAALELSSTDPWTVIDSIVIAKAIAFSLSFDLDTGPTQDLLTYVEAGNLGGFDGQALFFQDLFRAAPFDPAATVPDAMASQQRPFQRKRGSSRAGMRVDPDNLPIRPEVRALLRDYHEQAAAIPFLQRAVDRDLRPMGSNEWGVIGKRAVSGRPLLANDPHLSLDTPSTFYQNHLRTEDGLNVSGMSFPGVPLIVLGVNERICWGATTNPMDVTDIYQETVVIDPESPTFFSTVYQGNNEPLLALPISFRYNIPDDSTFDNLQPAAPNSIVDGTFIPPSVFIVPRRNDGPMVALDIVGGSGLSLQYTGSGATRELETFRRWNRAANLDEFRDALQFFDFGSQNFSYADIDGNIAYFTSAEMPIREDLQAGSVNGFLPLFIREGTGGNEWAPLSNPQPGQAIPFEILPFSEMPQIVNPSAGYFVNANNDPIGNTLDNDPFNETRPGGGIYYLNYAYATGLRAGRIDRLLKAQLGSGAVSFADMQTIQANVQLLDAEVLTPYIVAAFDNAGSAQSPLLTGLAADTAVAEAIGRLRNWDFSTPTGVLEGYDASDVDGTRLPPDAAEIGASIAATLYSVWRGQMIGNTIDNTVGALGLPRPGSSFAMSALRHLLDSYNANQGVGASGLNFFDVPAIADAGERRDYLLLKSLRDALDKLAGTDFASAFDLSTDQGDYRWGRLHRIVFDNPLGDPFSVPPAGGAFPPSFGDLPGIATDGGFGAVDASSHSARAANSNAFMFSSGPVRRYVGEPGTTPLSIRSETSLPGGASGVLGDQFYVNLLGRWLTNDTFPARQSPADYIPDYTSISVFVPAD